MNILIIGTGYVGATTGLVFSELGFQVTGLDIDSEKINTLNQGILHFYEPGLDALLKKHLEKGRIKFTVDTESAVKENDVIFICVGTPPNPDGSANLDSIKQVGHDIGRYMNGYKVIVNKSTVPVGTQEKVTQWILESQKEKHNFDVVSNPEFLREGSALEDAFQPDRIIIGSHSEQATLILKELYQSMNYPIVVTKPRAAELIKYAANSFLATKISFINELARLCDTLGVNVQEVAYGMGLDHRIGQSFLLAGLGYGGSCFPKDVDALLDTAREYNMNLDILEKVVSVNQTQYIYFLDVIRQVLGTFHKKTIAIFGLAFKPDTDDLRESRSLLMIKQLLDEQAFVKVYDPVAKVPGSFPRGVKQYDTPEKTAERAHAIIICTEWPQFKELDWAEISKNVKTAYLFDGRNLLNADKIKECGFYYRGIGMS